MTQQRSETTARSLDVDVIVIGAGAAGIAAARTLAANGLSYRVLEASARSGGRAFSDEAVPGAVFDRGCSWLHNADVNPLTKLADEHGIRYGGNTGRRFHLDGRFLDETECNVMKAQIEASLETVAAAGSAGRDVAAADVLAADAPHADLVNYIINAYYGVGPAAFSTLEAGEEEGTGQDWVVWDGLGNLIERLAGAVESTCDCPVRSIERSNGGVRVTSDRGVLRAGAAIVTVSTGVLQAELIRFDPVLPDEKRAALEALPMGTLEKIAMVFDRDRFGMPPNTYLAVEKDGQFMGFHFLGGPLLLAYNGGERGAEIARLDNAEAVARALDHLEHAYGTSLRPHLLTTAHTCWVDEPWIRGGYSAARPGGGHAQREVLARPLWDCLFFAGEATESHRFSTAHGAWCSGERAAGEAIAALRGQPAAQSADQ